MRVLLAAVVLLALTGLGSYVLAGMALRRGSHREAALTMRTVLLLDRLENDPMVSRLIRGEDPALADEVQAVKRALQDAYPKELHQ